MCIERKVLEIQIWFWIRYIKKECASTTNHVKPNFKIDMDKLSVLIGIV